MVKKTLRLPGIQPLEIGEWLIQDDVFDQQMAYRDHLLDTKRDQVYQAKSSSLPAQNELLALVLATLGEKYQQQESAMVRPDQRVVDLKQTPIIVAAQLVQEDLLILEGDQLTAAVVCFPASWTLSEKFGRGMAAIHGVVAEYDDDMSRRVGRLFNTIRPDQPLWRANFMVYENADLYQPTLEAETRSSKTGRFVRVERQTLRKLPETGAVVFGIHTYVVPIDTLSELERQELMKHLGASS